MTNHLVMEDDASSQTVDVKAQTMDAFSAEHGIERIHFAKVDVEGVELLVLRGAKKALAEHRIDVLQLEFNEQASARGLGGNALEELLQDNGYSLFRYDAAATMLMPVPTAGEAGEMNLLALHDPAAVGARLEG